ncbi:hypothetical protein FACS1894172_21740 [Spirochaetia bacterium]|nr:hypothetical protein FACS1894164_12460 [Spirochaetia bacterium]GHU38254.1 hypothetical protein FACS1894172_21740 [Spirochaetia bacterium]
MSAADVHAKVMSQVAAKFAGSADKITFATAFFDGEYDEGTMHLDGADWGIIRGILEGVSGEIDKDTLAALSGGLKG